MVDVEQLFGTLTVFSNGHTYFIHDVPNDLAELVIETFWHVKAGGELENDWTEVDDDADFAVWIALEYSIIDGLVWQEAA